MSCIKLHELSANKRVPKTDKFQLYMHPVTASLLDGVGGAGSVGLWVHGSEILAWIIREMKQFRKWKTT